MHWSLFSVFFFFLVVFSFSTNFQTKTKLVTAATGLGEANIFRKELVFMHGNKDIHFWKWVFKWFDVLRSRCMSGGAQTAKVIPSCNRINSKN